MMPRVPWPPPAHQGDLYPRGYGIYSPYSPGDPGLYSPSAKLPPAFVPSPKGTEPLFTITGGGHIPGVAMSPLSSTRFQHNMDLMKKSPYTPPGSVKDEGSDIERSNGCTPIPAVTMTHLNEPPTLGSPVTVIDLSTSDASKKVAAVKVEGGGSHSNNNYNIKKKRALPLPASEGGCSRTTPLTLRTPAEVLVKKEPEHLLSPNLETSVFLSPSSDTDVKGVKVETTEAKTKETDCLSPVSASGGNISVGLTVSRHCQQHADSPLCLPSALHPSQESAPLLGAIFNGGGVCDDRSSNLLPSWPAQAHNPQLWQYSAPLEQFTGYPPVGYQLVRDPLSGHLLLIPPTSVEAMQRAIFWPSYAGAPSQMILPPPTSQHILLESSVATTPHLVLDSTVRTSMDFISSDAVHHQSPQRRILITTDQSKIVAPAVIKLEASDCSSAAVVVTTCDSSNVYSKSTVNSCTSEAAVFYSTPVEKPSKEIEDNPRIQDTPIVEVEDRATPPVPPLVLPPSPSSTSPLPAPPLPPPPVDVTGLELLSNSIEKHVVVESPAVAPPAPPLRRLDVLCALAEQLRGDDSQEAKTVTMKEEPSPQLMDTPPCSPSSADSELSPPILEKVTEITFDGESDISKPPKLTPNIPDDMHEGSDSCDTGRKRSASVDCATASSRKKRKVGRPRKQSLATEMMLVTKKKVSESSKLRKVRPKHKFHKEPPALEQIKSEPTSLKPCVGLSATHLTADQLPLRVLMAKGSVFHAGQLSAIEAPDVYGITIDGERRHRPDIFSREEIIKNTILEVKPRSSSDVPEGSRICAYWSDLYRCLYPGTVTAGTDTDDRFISVEFDDGDSGRIAITDVRLLPPDHPVSVSEKPSSTLPKRKRRSSGSIEQQITEKTMQSVVKVEKFPEKEADEPIVRLQDDVAVTTDVQEEVQKDQQRDPEQERRHLKKRRREKLRRLQSLAADGTTHKDLSRDRNGSDESHHHRKRKHRHHHKKHRKHKHRKKQRNPSTDSNSQMAKLLPEKLLWGWASEGNTRPGQKGRTKKIFHVAIRRGREVIKVGDCAVFLSTGRPDRPYIGRIVSLWQAANGGSQVRVKWFYHPEETISCSAKLKYPGALFDSPHEDTNDVQTISHKCEVLAVDEFKQRLDNDPSCLNNIYENNELFYLAGYYDPTCMSLTMRPGVEELA